MVTILNDMKMMNWLTLYVPLLILSVGAVGTLCNVIIFTSKQFRRNSCAFYFLCSSVFDIFYLLFSGITRAMSDHFSDIFPNRSILFCKCRTYLVVTIPSLSTLFLMLASIDRCLSTSSSLKWRNLSRINVAWRVSILTLVLSLVSNCHVLFYYELEKKDVDVNLYKCVPHPGIYRIFIAIYLFLSSPFLTYTIMFICTVITLTRIRKSRYRVGSLYNRKSKRRHRDIDHQLIIIMFTQIGLGMLLTFFRCGFLVYSLSTNSVKKNMYRTSIEAFLDRFSLLIYYMNFAKSFSVNILTSPLFRQVFRQRFREICLVRKGKIRK